MSEIYSMINDFNSGLMNHELLKIINDSEIITTICNDVKGDDDVINIEFNTIISETERTELNTIITNYNYVVEDEYDARYISFAFDFDNVDSDGVTSSNHVLINNGVNAGSFNISNGELTIIEKGSYTFSLFYDNKTLLNGTDFYKIYMSEKNGNNSIYSRNVLSRNEPIGTLDQIISSTMIVPANSIYCFNMKEILGNGNSSFNCIMQIIRNF